MGVCHKRKQGLSADNNLPVTSKTTKALVYLSTRALYMYIHWAIVLEQASQTLEVITNQRKCVQRDTGLSRLLRLSRNSLDVIILQLNGWVIYQLSVPQALLYLLQVGQDNGTELYLKWYVLKLVFDWRY